MFHRNWNDTLLATSPSCCGCCVCKPSPRTGTDDKFNLVVCVAIAIVRTFFPAVGCGYLAGLLGGRKPACLTVCLPGATCARESCAAETMYPLKWTNKPPAHQLTRWGSIGLIIGHYLHKYLHKSHQNWPFKSRNCTYFGDNRGRDTDSRPSQKVIYIHRFRGLPQASSKTKDNRQTQGNASGDRLDQVRYTKL